MDRSQVLRQGLDNSGPGSMHHYAASIRQRHPLDTHDELSGVAGAGGARIAHTLTACCRCRQRKTRCDPTLPRCLPCERSGAVCEYLDPAKGRKINRSYVVRLQDKVKALEAELDQYIDDSGDYPRTNEDIVQPGGLVRLNANDESPRYLGPSSGIALSRLLMEQAKKYTDSSRISEIIPEVAARRQARMQSIQTTVPTANRRKSYPMISERPLESLPTRAVANKLVEMFNQKAQFFWPCLHRKVLESTLEAVFENDRDPYRNFVVRMVFAISLQKLDTQYAGLADSYYLAAMLLFQDVVKPQDLNTIQCLVLIAQYSLLTPARTPVYYVIGLAVKICQQEGLTDESTIAAGYNLNPLTIDMRRRLVWIVNALELGLAHSMGRPNFFAKGLDTMNVEFFAAVDDEHITESGIDNTAPPSEEKLAAIHFYKMRLCQASIRRCLYERKRPQPKTDTHPWFEQMERELLSWLESCPENPVWCKPWFTSRYHQMKVFMYRPSPQIPKPSAKAANTCFESSAHVIKVSQMQMRNPEITWVFLLTLTMSLNAMLWATSYPETRLTHPRAEVEELVNIALDVLDQSVDRWPGTASSSPLYAIIARACLQSYDAKGSEGGPGSAPSTLSAPDFFETQATPPLGFGASNAAQQVPYLNPPQFGQVFDSPPETMNAYQMHSHFPPPHPSFRSNSIFHHPSTTDHFGRRFSYFPPEAPNPMVASQPDPNVPVNPSPSQSFTPQTGLDQELPTPPESMSTSSLSNSAFSPGLQPQFASMAAMSAAPLPASSGPQAMTSPPPQSALSVPQASPAQPGSLIDPFEPKSSANSTEPSLQQRPLPNVTSMGEWFAPQVSMSAAAFSYPSANNTSTSAGLFSNNFGASANMHDIAGIGLGLQNFGASGFATGFQPGVAPERQGSLTQSQQMELMDVLETEGVSDIDAFLSANNSIQPDGPYQ